MLYRGLSSISKEIFLFSRLIQRKKEGNLPIAKVDPAEAILASPNATIHFAPIRYIAS